MKKSLLVILVLALFTSIQANALQDLNFKGFIADEVHLLSENTKYNLNMTLWDLQKKSGADIAVVVLPSLEGRRVEDVALEIGRKYKVGSKEKNNGIVFLTAINDRKMRIELGYGFEKIIAISDLDFIRDNDILPYYRQNDYENGITRGTYQLTDLAARAEGVVVTRTGNCPDKALSYNTGKASSHSHTPWWVWPIAIVMSIFSPRRRNGFGSSGFGGGGGFGGCGSSGSW